MSILVLFSKSNDKKEQNANRPKENEAENLLVNFNKKIFEAVPSTISQRESVALMFNGLLIKIHMQCV